MSSSAHSSYQLGAGSIGDVGVLNDEHAQRLVSIFGEAALQCLDQLRRMSEKKDAVSAPRLYAAGLATIPKWNADIMAEEVARLQATYPEAETLLHYCFACLAGELNAGAVPTLPSISEGYRLFLCRVAGSPDVQAPGFVALPHVLRRGVFVDALRMSLHDLYRRAEPMHEPPRLRRVAPETERADVAAEDAVSRKSGETRGESTKSQGKNKSALAEALRQEEQQQRVERVADEPAPSVGPSSSIRSVKIEGPCFF